MRTSSRAASTTSTCSDRARALLLTLALLAALLPAPLAAAQRVRVEGVAALVGGTTTGAGAVPILRSDVVLRARIALAGVSDAPRSAPIPASLLAATLDEVIGEVLIAREADRLRAARPAAEEVARERARLEVQAGGSAALAAIAREAAIEEAELDAIAQRRAYVNAFLRANLEGSTTVSDAQLAREYESGEHPFANRPLEEVREPLRAFVAQRMLHRDVARWLEVLRRRTPVRILAEWRREGEGS